MVDRIGKGGATPPTAAPTGPARPQEAGKTFDAGKAAAARPPDQVEAIQPPLLDQLKAGKIDFNEYLDEKVREATSHLDGLTPTQIDMVRTTLRDRMATDPELVDLIKQATGLLSSPNE
jgi:hypothetical protein